MRILPPEPELRIQIKNDRIKCQPHDERKNNQIRIRQSKIMDHFMPDLDLTGQNYSSLSVFISYFLLNVQEVLTLFVMGLILSSFFQNYFYSQN